MVIPTHILRWLVHHCTFFFVALPSKRHERTTERLRRDVQGFLGERGGESVKKSISCWLVLLRHVDVLNRCGVLDTCGGNNCIGSLARAISCTFCVLFGCALMPPQKAHSYIPPKTVRDTRQAYHQCCSSIAFVARDEIGIYCLRPPLAQ